MSISNASDRIDRILSQYVRIQTGPEYSEEIVGLRRLVGVHGAMEGRDS